MHGIAIAILSIRLSDAYILTKQNDALRCVDILIPHEREITLVFWHSQWLVGDAPSLLNIRRKWPTPFKKRRFRNINISVQGHPHV